MSEIVLYDRRRGERCREVIHEKWFMDLFYGTLPGRWLAVLLFSRRWFSRLYGRLQRRPASRRKILPFVERHGIDPTESERPPQEYPDFAAFFARRLKPARRPIEFDPDVLIAPADGRLLAFSVQHGQVYPVKGAYFDLEELAPGALPADRYANGLCLILRLAPGDPHRFCQVDDGMQSAVRGFPGRLHSVSPLALRHGLNVFPSNYRHCCTVESRSFGSIFVMEVGALTVGSIHQCIPDGGAVRRGEEKGWFEVGGSTVILLLEAGRARVDDDITQQSLAGVESLVRLGERIGTRFVGGPT